MAKELVIPGRLEQLRREGESQRAFAKRLGVDHRRLDEWLDGSRAPNAESLRALQRKTSVSIDWLLGDDTAPMYRGQGRSPAGLAADVRTHIARELAERSRGEPWRHELGNMTIDAEEFLAVGVERELSDLREAWARASTAAVAGEESISGVLMTLEFSDALAGRSTRAAPDNQFRGAVLKDWLSRLSDSEFYRVHNSRVLRHWMAHAKAKGFAETDMDLGADRLVPDAFRALRRPKKTLKSVGRLADKRSSHIASRSAASADNSVVLTHKLHNHLTKGRAKKAAPKRSKSPG